MCRKHGGQLGNPGSGISGLNTIYPPIRSDKDDRVFNTVLMSCNIIDRKMFDSASTGPNALSVLPAIISPLPGNNSADDIQGLHRHVGGASASLPDFRSQT